MSWDSGLNKKEKGSNTSVYSSLALTVSTKLSVASCSLWSYYFVFKNACRIKEEKRKGTDSLENSFKVKT